MKQPLLTIVIATRNSEGVLAGCLGSLAEQTYSGFEVIIQDGASTDGTLGVAQSFAQVLPGLVVNSEADSGLYDAWNKTLPHIRGRWTLFLGSDDALAGPDVLERCAAVLSGLPEQVLYACGDVLEIYPDASASAQACLPEGALGRMGEHIPFCHSSLWQRSSLFAGQRFDTSLRIAADYDFICRTWPDDNVGRGLGFTVTHMRRGGLSSNPRQRLRILWENARVAARYGHPVFTIRRIVPLLKAIVLWGVCVCAGSRGPALLDRIRTLRGLAPCWTTTTPRGKGNVL